MKFILAFTVFCLSCSPLTFSQTAWTIVKQGLVVADPPFSQCHASTLVALRSGEIMMAWFGGAHEGSNDVVIWCSTLKKKSWTKPVAVADGIVNDSLRFPTWNPVLFQEKGGVLFLFYKVGPNPRQWWGMVKTSTNGGKSWSAPRRLPPGILGPIKNKPFQLPDGAILSPSSTETDTRWRAHVERSSDGGRTWTYIPIDTAGKFDVIQPSIIKFADGRLQVLCRSKQGFVMQSSSLDNGNTWSALTPTSLINPNAGTDAVTLTNGHQMIVYNPDVPGKDWWNGRSKLRVAVSKDGATWTDVAVLEDGTTGEYSYPAIIQTHDAKVHLSYTFNRKNIKYVVLEGGK
ncbi:MAG TPA: sialidase family protein [Chryseosolibacter sp.]